MRAYDEAGNERISTVTFYVDHTPPTGDITVPAEYDAFRPGTINISGYYTDNNVSALYALLAYGSGENPPSYGYSYIMSTSGVEKNGLLASWSIGVGDRYYTLKLTLRDTMNEVNIYRRICVDNTPPASAIITPLAGQKMPGLVTIKGQARDFLSGVAKVQVKILDANDNVVVDWTDASGTTEWTYVWDATSRPDGAGFKVQSRAVDRAGNIETPKPAVSFTLDTAPLQVSAVQPTNGATDVSTQAEIKAYFNKALDAASVNTTTFTLRDAGGNPVLGEVTYGDNGVQHWVTFRPFAPLAPGAYTATVTTGIKDSSGNPLGSDYSWSFNVVNVDAKIYVPVDGSYVAGVTPIYGIARALNFQEYRLEYSNDGNSWTTITTSNQPSTFTVVTHTTESDFAGGMANNVTSAGGKLRLAGNDIVTTTQSDFTYRLTNVLRGKTYTRSVNPAESNSYWNDNAGDFTDGRVGVSSSDTAFICYTLSNYGISTGQTFSVEFTVDCGTVKRISRVRAASGAVLNANYRADKVEVYTSADGSNYTKVAESTSFVGGWADLPFPVQNARYVKFKFYRTRTSDANTNYLEINEGEAYDMDSSVVVEAGPYVDWQAIPGSLTLRRTGQQAKDAKSLNYIAGEYKEWVIDERAAGISAMHLYFSRIDVYGWDYLRVYYSNDGITWNAYATYNGTYGSVFLTNVPGKMVKLVWGPTQGNNYPGWQLGYYVPVDSTGKQVDKYVSDYAVFQYDLGQGPLEWQVEKKTREEGGSSITWYYRSSDDAYTWSNWETDLAQVPLRRFLQVKAVFNPTIDVAPVIEEVRVNYRTTATGEYLSPVIDSGGSGDWYYLAWSAAGPGTVTIQTRTGDTPTPDASWSTWSAPYLNPNGDKITSPARRYLQYRVLFADATFATAVDEVKVGYGSLLGNWDTSSLSSGTYFLRLTVTDSSSASASHVISVVIENDLPQATITAPVDGDAVPAFTVIRGTASDPSSGVSKVEVSIDNGPWQEADGQENWTFLWDTSAYENGSLHTIRARAVDRAGNVGPETAAITVRVDNVTPVSSCTFNPATPDGSNGWYKTAPQVTLSADNLDSPTVSGLKTGALFYQLTPQSVTNDPGSGYNQYSGPFTVPDGTWRIWYYAVDGAGNRENAHYVDVQVDTGVPTINVTRPQEGGYVNPTGYITSSYFEGTSSDSLSGLSKVEVSDNNNTWRQVTVDGNGRWIIRIGDFITNYTEGPHTLYVRAYDNAGNAVTVARNVIYDSTLPTISLQSSLANYSWVRNGTQITLTGTANDANFDRWEITLNGTVVLSGNTPVVNGTFGTIVFNDPAELKDMIIYLYAYDKAGNMRNTSLTYYLDNFSPLAYFTLTDDYLYCAGGCNQTVNGEVSEKGSGVAVVEVSLDGQNWTAATYSSTNNTFTATVAIPDTEGEYILRCRARDNAGNLLESPYTVRVMVDKTPPVIVGKPIAKPDNSLGGINLTWKPATDNASGVAYYEVMRDGNPTPIILYYLDGNRAQTSRFYANVAVDKEMAPNTSHTYRYRAVDRAGNVSAWSEVGAALYDTIAPSAPGNLRASQAGIAKVVTLEWDPAYDNTGIGGYIIYRSTDGTNFVEIGRTRVGTQVITRFMDDKVVAGQTYYYKVQAFDNAQPQPNVSSYSNQVSVTVVGGSSTTSPHGNYQSTATCAYCHKTHTASGPNLMAEAIESTVCYRCHDGSGSQYAIKAEIDYNPTHHRVKTQDSPGYILNCTSCHDPHMNSSQYPKLLRSKDPDGIVRTGGTEFCLNCHGDKGAPSPGGSQAQYLTSIHYSGNNPKIAPYPGTGVDCLYCHENHGSPYFRQTIQNEAEVCFQCHGQGMEYNNKNGWDIYGQFNNPNPGSSRHGIDKAGAIVKCTSCHGQRFISSYSLDDNMPTSDLSNPYNIKEVLAKGRYATNIGVINSINDFCLACHNSNPPVAESTATKIVPYTITYPANDVTTSANGWDRTSYQTPGVAHYDKGYTCRRCHHPHGTDYLRLTLRPTDAKNGDTIVQGMCFECHSNPPKDGADNIMQDYQKAYTHPLGAGGYHRDNENYYLMPQEKRHANCNDCHDPHTATKEKSPQGSPLGAGTQNNVSGVKVFNGPAGSTPEYAFLSSVSLEYELCFKCHSAYSYGSTPPPGQKDKSVEFNPNNASYHPVEAKGKNRYIKPETFVNGWSADSIVKCTDCHGSDSSNISGPHGSIYPHILKAPYKTVSWTDPNMLCYRCHSYAVYAQGAPGSRFPKHGTKQYHYRPCWACHTVHGSPTYQRLGDGETAKINISGSSRNVCHYYYTPQY